MNILQFLSGANLLGSVPSLIKGDKPIFVPDGQEQYACDILGREPAYYDPSTGMWAFVVPKNQQEQAINSLKKRGFK